MERKVTVVDREGRKLAKMRVALVRKGDYYEEITDSKGEAYIDFPGDWADELRVNDQVLKRDIDLSGGWGGAVKELPKVVWATQGMVRSVRLRYDDGTDAAGKLVEFVKGSERKRGRSGANGVVQIEWEPDYIDAIIIDGVLVQRDVDLSGGWLGGPKRNLDDIKLSRAGAGVRRLQLVYKDGEPVSELLVGFFKGGEAEVRRSDKEGVVLLRWPFDWVDRVEVEQQVVKTNWDLSTMVATQRDDLGELVIARPEEENPHDTLETVNRGLFEQGEDQGVRGRLFYRDGTQCYERFRIEVEFNDPVEERRWGVESKADGSFFIPTPRYQKGFWVKRMFVDGDEIPKTMFFRGARSPWYCVVLPPKLMRSGKGTKGGLITGRVVDPDGSNAFEAKITVEVANAGWLPMNESAVVYTDKHGRFALPFTGGTRIKRMYVDGSEPTRITIGKPPNVQELSSRDLPAGTFNIRIVRKRKLLGNLF